LSKNSILEVSKNQEMDDSMLKYSIKDSKNKKYNLSDKNNNNSKMYNSNTSLNKSSAKTINENKYLSRDESNIDLSDINLSNNLHTTVKKNNSSFKEHNKSTFSSSINKKSLELNLSKVRQMNQVEIEQDLKNENNNLRDSFNHSQLFIDKDVDLSCNDSMNLNISTNSNKKDITIAVSEYNTNPSILHLYSTKEDNQSQLIANTQSSKETKDQINPNTNRGLYQK